MHRQFRGLLYYVSSACVKCDTNTLRIHLERKYCVGHKYMKNTSRKDTLYNIHVEIHLIFNTFIHKYFPEAFKKGTVYSVKAFQMY